MEQTNRHGANKLTWRKQTGMEQTNRHGANKLAWSKQTGMEQTKRHGANNRHGANKAAWRKQTGIEQTKWHEANKPAWSKHSSMERTGGTEETACSRGGGRPCLALHTFGVHTLRISASVAGARCMPAPPPPAATMPLLETQRAVSTSVAWRLSSGCFKGYSLKRSSTMTFEKHALRVSGWRA
eukprot:365427-Chlamydomonas_euryale.AAC.3